MELAKKARIAIVGLIGAGAITSGVAFASPALADSHGCGDNICVTVSGPAGGDVTVRTWAASSTFSGTFELTGPLSYDSTSAGDTWNGGDEADSFTFTVPAAAVGQYCVYGHSYDGTNQGAACESVS